MTENLPETDDAPWLNLSQEEINQLWYNNKNLHYMLKKEWKNLC